ncbi:MAG TPA: DUF2764 family protein [Gammaproteobacteria bacterium]|nr:DUF2764 family protein [Gammaproteobacteria bacterium]
MRRRSRRYYMLVCSLPALPPRLDDPRPAISKERLADRLRMLEPEDAAEIDTLRAVLDWGHQFGEADDTVIVERAAELVARAKNSLVHEILELGMDTRMIAAALRSRRRNVPLPAVGFGALLGHLRRNLHKPDLGLRQRYPWIAAADELLARGDLLSLQRRFVANGLWEYCTRRAEAYMFELEAVVLYVVRWDCLRRWRQLDADRGRAIFETLVKETLGEYANGYA